MASLTPMYSYDRRNSKIAGSVGALGVSLEQITSAVQAKLGLPPGYVPNIMFGAVSSGERELSVSFQAMVMGKSVPGRVVFRILEANSRMWGGSAILLDGTVEI